MAYKSANLFRLFDGSSGLNEWQYITTDAFATVSASNYFNDAYIQGVNPGDSIAVIVFTSELSGGYFTGYSSYTPAVFTSVTSSGGTVASVAAAGTMIYPSAGIANSTGSAWTIPYTTSGTGTVLALSASPTLTTPNLGTPSAGVLTNCSGTAAALTAGTVSTISGLISAGTNVTVTGSGTSGSPYSIASTGGGGMTYPGAGVPQSTGSAWGASITLGTGVGTALTANVNGSGAISLATSPTFVTPTLGAATAASINKMAITAPATSSTLAVADGKTATINNTVTLTGTDSATYNLASMNTDAIEFVIDGGGSAITTGVKGYLEIPYACTINRATLLADQSGSIVVDVWKTTYASFDGGATHPVSGDKITASAPPTISSATKAQDATLTGWTTSVSAGDILAFNVNSATTVTRITISLKVAKS